jgi:hypothetical protein
LVHTTRSGGESTTLRVKGEDGTQTYIVKMDALASIGDLRHHLDRHRCAHEHLSVTVVRGGDSQAADGVGAARRQECRIYRSSAENLNQAEPCLYRVCGRV